MKLKDQILQLRNEGKTFDEIKSILNCSKSTISYHLSDEQKEKTKNRQIEFRSKNPISSKLEKFKTKSVENKSSHFFRDNRSENIGYKELINILSVNPICYLTGQKINLNDGKSYELDHKIPKSKGGNSTMSNMGLATSIANRAKGALSIEEFFELCKQVVIHNKLLDN